MLTSYSVILPNLPRNIVRRVISLEFVPYINNLFEIKIIIY